MIMPESGDPFVLMDLAKYQELLEQPKSRSRKSNAKQMASDLALWEQTKKELGSIAAEPQELDRQEPEIVSLDPASPPNAEEKYYFEPIQTEGSQSETTK